MANRAELAEKLDLVGLMFEIDGMSDLLKKFERDMNPVKFNAVVIQVESLLMRENERVADKLIAANREITLDEVGQLDDADYANALKTAILQDVIGFFASSPATDGRK